MSNYRNFIEDFPSRCKDLLILAHKKAELSDREVTLTLMVASAGFLIPFERLRSDGVYIQPTQDRKRFRNLAAEFDKLLAKTWADSPFDKGDEHPWYTGELMRPESPIDEWRELDKLEPLSSITTVGEIILMIRHALAHGNIYTRPTLNKKIQAVIFVSGGNRKDAKIQLKPYKFVHVSPYDFREFLLTWFELLASWNISQEDVLEALEKAA